MALALLTFDGMDGDGARFTLDIGTNNFFKLKIGRGITTTKGIDQVDDVTSETPLARWPPSVGFSSRFPFTVPGDSFNREARYAQLYSFKDAMKRSPAISEVVEVYPSGDTAPPGLPFRAPASFPGGMPRRQRGNAHPPGTSGCRAVPFSFSRKSPGRAAANFPGGKSPVASPVRSVAGSVAFGHRGPPHRSFLSLQKGTPLPVNGGPRCVYSGKGTIRFLAHLRIADGLKKGGKGEGMILLRIQDANTRKALLEKRYRLQEMVANSMEALELFPSETRVLPRNTGLLVSASFHHHDKGNRSTPALADSFPVTLTGDYFLMQFGEQKGEAVPLGDRAGDRNFWNKIWESEVRSSRQKRWEINVDTVYYVYYRPDQESNVRIETRLRLSQTDSDSEKELKVEGEMESGLEITPAELNRLLPRISPQPPLDQARLEAFRTGDLGREFNGEARMALHLKGKTRETGMILTYPEVGLFEVVLGRVEKVDENGQVIGTREEKVLFPKPVSIRFAGEMRKTTDSPPGVEDAGDMAPGPGWETPSLSGNEQVFDLKADLKPAELVPLSTRGEEDHG